MSNLALTNALAEAMDGAILEDNKTHTNRIQIRSESSDALYIVSQHKLNGDWQCSCRGWIFKRNCKHLKAMAPILELGTAQLALPKKASKPKAPAKKAPKKTAAKAKPRKKASA